MEHLKYAGLIIYENSKMASISKRFEFIGDGHIVLHWHIPAEAKDSTPCQFLGVAQEILENKFITPWIYLTNQDGSHLDDEEMAQIDFTIISHNGSELEVEGKWVDVNLDEYPFRATLNRIQEKNYG